MTSSIKIEKGVPIPTKPKMVKGFKGIIRKMEINDSVFYPNLESGRRTAYLVAKATGFKFLTRAEASGVRIWRVS